VIGRGAAEVVSVSRRGRLVAITCLFVGCLVAVVVAGSLWLHPRSSSPSALGAAPAILPLDVPAPEFTLTGQFGEPVSMHHFRGKAVVLAFVDSQCTTICPLTTATLTSARDDLGAAASRVQLLGINANPLATSVAAVHAYSQAHDLLYRWNFLTGSKQRLSAVWRDYHVYAAAIAGKIDHDPIVFVIDPNGRERAIFHTAMSYASIGVQAAELAQAIAKSLDPNGSVRASTGPAPTSLVLPTQNATLPVVAGTPSTAVVIGPGHAHLIVFLASWLTQTSSMNAQVATLNAYQRTAQRRGLPSLIAIDLATTEPRADSLASTLAALRVQPRFPVVSDTSGAVADGYQAQDAPWLILTARNGRPQWQHGGWLTAGELLASVARAAR